MKWADLTATGGQLSRPPTGSSMAAYGHFPMAADRHTALTWMADAGIDLHILQRVAGHQDSP